MSKKSGRWLVNIATTPALRRDQNHQCQTQCQTQCQKETWHTLSALQIMTYLESGEYDTEVVVKAGNEAKPKPLRIFLRELVWESRTEQRLSNTGHDPNGLYLEIVDLAPIPTALSDLGGRISYVNQAFCNFLGYERSELIGMTVGQLSVPDDHAIERNQGNQVISGKQRGFQMEKRYLHKSGEERVGLLSISLLRDEDGAPTSVMAQIADLSEVKLMQEELLKSQSLAVAGRLAQEVTHDLKNILMTLKGTLDLLQLREDVLDSEERELIEGGLGVCESGHHLVRSLLDLQAPLSFGELDLKTWLPQQLPLLSRFAAPYPISYSINIKDDSAMILADARSLERALMNLCVNAKQALKRQSNLERRQLGIKLSLNVSSSTQTELLGVPGFSISVQDFGEGIETSQLEKVAQPYFTTRSQEGGHGLGLAVVWSVCHHHGGTLSVESELNIGSTFTLVLPRIDSTVQASTQQVNQSTKQSMERKSSEGA